MSEPKKRKLWEKIVMGAVIGGAIGSVVGGTVGGEKKAEAPQPEQKPKKRSIILRVLSLLLSRKKKIPHEEI